MGVTGLALTAFLVAGYDGTGDHDFDATVRKGLDWLQKTQDDDGCFGSRTIVDPEEHQEHGGNIVIRTRDGRVDRRLEGLANRPSYVYNHAAASLAMVEAYGLTGSEKWKDSAQRALDFIALARNPYFAWRYGIKPGDNDTSVTGWMLLPIAVARMINRVDKEASLRVDEAAFDGARAWLDKTTDTDYGRVGYILRGTGPCRDSKYVDKFPSEKSESLTALGMLMRMLGGDDPRKSKLIRMGASLCGKLPPRWNTRDGSIDFIYWHFGSLAMHRVGGTAWRRWLEAIEPALVEHQRTEGDNEGSWDPVGAWGHAGGRVYATAINALTLLTPVRFEGAKR